MDEFNDIVVDSSPALPVKNPVGDISDRVAIRQTCLNGGPSHNFSWLLDNVYPELFVPVYFMIKHSSTRSTLVWFYLINMHV